MTEKTWGGLHPLGVRCVVQGPPFLFLLPWRRLGRQSPPQPAGKGFLVFVLFFDKSKFGVKDCGAGD